MASFAPTKPADVPAEVWDKLDPGDKEKWSLWEPEEKQTAIASIVSEIGSAVASLPQEKSDGDKEEQAGQPAVRQKADQSAIDAVMETIPPSEVPLLWTIKLGQEEPTHVLLDAGMDPNEVDRSVTKMNALQWAAEKGASSSVVQRLIDGVTNLNAANFLDGSTALHIAALHNRVDIVHSLIQAGADVNAQNEDDETPLNVAIDKSHAGIIKLLRDNGGTE